MPLYLNCLEIYLLVQTQSHESAGRNRSVSQLSAPGSWERLIQFIFTFITALGFGNSEEPSLPLEVLRLGLEAGLTASLIFFILNVISAPKNWEAVAPMEESPRIPC